MFIKFSMWVFQRVKIKWSYFARLSPSGFWQKYNFHWPPVRLDLTAIRSRPAALTEPYTCSDINLYTRAQHQCTHTHTFMHTGANVQTHTSTHGRNIHVRTHTLRERVRVRVNTQLYALAPHTFFLWNTSFHSPQVRGYAQIIRFTFIPKRSR